MINDEFINLLNDHSRDDFERLRIVKERLSSYCLENENKFNCWRVLMTIKRDMEYCYQDQKRFGAEKSIIERILKILGDEMKIVKYSIKYPELKINGIKKDGLPSLIWTADKIDLVELIYAIKNSLNGGDVDIIDITRCFEYIFNVKLQHLVYGYIKRISLREDPRTEYLNNLIINLDRFLDELID